MKRFALALLLFASSVQAQVVVHADARGVVVGRTGVVEVYARDGKTLRLTTTGVKSPAAIVTSQDRVAVLDPLANEVSITDLATKKSTSIRTGETPIDGIFIGRNLYLLARDANALERIGADGSKTSIALASDPAFLRERNGTLYTYSRATGVLQEISTSPFIVKRSVRVRPFASDLEVDGQNAYLAYPRDANIGVVKLATMKTSGRIDAGAVPIDVAFAAGGSALTARTLAIADPSGKRVWLIEGAQTISQAIARGFLRGLLGLGLAGSRGSQFPTGVDRVAIRGSRWYAYDSSARTLFRFTKRNSRVLAKNVAPTAFSVGPDAVFVWDETVRRLQRLDAE